MRQGKHRPSTSIARRAGVLAATAAIGGLLATTAFGASLAGDPDTSFASGGSIDIAQLSGLSAFSVIAQPDGKTLVSDYNRVIRLNADGSPDQTFGISGVARYPDEDGIGQTFVNEHGLAIDKQGRILVVGETFQAQPEGSFAVLRLLPDGTPDPSFGKGGIQSINVLPNVNETANAVLVDAQGRYVIVGRAGTTEAGRPAIVRMYDTGNLDSSFASGGKAVLTVTVPTDGEAVALDGTDIVMASMETGGGATPHAAVLTKFTSSGDLSSGFGTGGNARTTALPYFQSDSLVVLPDHRIRLIGAVSNESALETSRGVLSGFTAAGQPDLAVGQAGQRQYDLTPGSGTTFSAGALSGSQLVVAGIRGLKVNGEVASADAMVGRLSVDGVPDPTFSGDGYAGPTGGSVFAIPEAITTQADGKILTVGWLNTGSDKTSTRIARYFGQDVPDPTPTPAPVPAATPTPAPVPTPVVTPVPKLTPVPSSIAFSSTKLSDGRTRIKSVTVKGLKTGDVVAYVCATKARGCTKAASGKATIKKGTSLTLTALRSLKLAPKATITITVSRNGFASRVVTFTTISKKSPTQATQCLAPGAAKPTSC